MQIIKKNINIFITLVFALYNFIFGFYYGIIWNKVIFFYYLILLLIKLILILFININKCKKIIYIISFILLLLLCISLIAPSVLLLKQERNINIGLIPSIVYAAYTTYSIVYSIIMFNKYKRVNILYKQLKLVSIINVSISILTLQNTLIVVNGGYDNEIVILCIFTTIGVIILSVGIIIYSFIKTIKSIDNDKKQKPT